MPDGGGVEIEPIGFTNGSPPAFSGSFPATFTGPFSSGQAITVFYSVFNNTVILDIPAVNASASVSGVASATASGVVPSSIRPISTTFAMAQIQANAFIINQPGTVQISSDGNIKITADIVGTGVFSILGNNGWRRTSVSYTLN